MRYSRVLLVAGIMLLHGCGSNESPPNLYPWSIEEEGPPAELWHSVSPLSTNDHPAARPPNRCDITPFVARFDTRVGKAWLSVGGPFAIPTRHWINCEDHASYSIADDYYLWCDSAGLTLFSRDDKTTSKLPGWLESQIDWEKGFETRDLADPTTIARFNLPLRIYNPQTGKLTEQNVGFQVHSDSLRATPSDTLDGPICLPMLSGHDIGPVDISGRCGDDTNCRIETLE